jgi:hypothetical protein
MAQSRKHTQVQIGNATIILPMIDITLLLVITSSERSSLVIHHSHFDQHITVIITAGRHESQLQQHS